MKNYLYAFVWLFLIASAHLLPVQSQSKDNSKTIFGIYDGSKIRQLQGATEYSLQLMPGRTFHGWLYFWSMSTSTPAGFNLSVQEGVNWVSVYPNNFTAANCTDVVPVCFSFTAPQAAGTYTAVVSNLSNPSSPINVTLTVTPTPAVSYEGNYQMKRDSTVTMTERKYYGFVTNQWSGYCGPNTYAPGDSQDISITIVPHYDWITIAPENFTVPLNDSVMVTKSATPHNTGFFTIYEICESQWYTYPLYYKWNVNVIPPVGIDDKYGVLPVNEALTQNYPNPFNSATIIRYTVVKDAKVKLIVYDIFGRMAAVLIDEYKQPGNYEAKFDATEFPSGVYYYRLITGSTTSPAKKMIVLK